MFLLMVSANFSIGPKVGLLMPPTVPRRLLLSNLNPEGKSPARGAMTIDTPRRIGKKALRISLTPHQTATRTPEP
jgi:hypothetical protein